MINTILYIIKTNLNMIKTIYNSINIKTVKIQFISVKRILADLKAIFYIERILSLEFFKLGRNVIFHIEVDARACEGVNFNVKFRL